MRPQVKLLDAAGKEVKIPGTDHSVTIGFPVGALIQVRDGQDLAPGEVLARIPVEGQKTRDITGGLPRVAELFEARRPKDPATISEVDGVVKFGEIKRGKREIFVQPLIRRWLGLQLSQPEIIQAMLTRKVTSPPGDDDYMRVVVGQVEQSPLRGFPGVSAASAYIGSWRYGAAIPRAWHRR